jgi:hypothetical protein
MKTKLLLFLIAVGFFYVNSSNAQNSWSDYIMETRGDTVVVVPTSTTGYLNTIFHAVMGDTTSTGDRTNPNRVYETVRGGVYIYDGPAKIDATVPNLRIVAPDGTERPPLHIKTTNPEGGLSKIFYELAGDFYAENQYFCFALTNNTLDRHAFDPKSEYQTFEFNNCVLEMTNWAIIANWSTGLSVKFTNCFIHNIGREASLEKGVIIDGASSLKELYLENNTFLNFGMVVLNRAAAGTADMYVNHNTFVNSTNNPFGCYTQANQIVTNNLFVNTGLVPDYPGFYTFLEDGDQLPKGIINVDTVTTAMKDDYYQFEYPYDNESERKILVDRNGAWWHDDFNTMFENGLVDPSPNEWNDQKITMNSRTKDMFEDDESYPYFTQGEWFSDKPDFANLNEELIGKWVEFIVTNSDPAAINAGVPQPVWRTNDVEDLTEVDWPILADLSYSNSTLKSGALAGYPLGDLNWFPNEKAKWVNRNEREKLIAARDNGEIPTSVKENVLKSSNNMSIYPNPTAEKAIISFTLDEASDVEFILYNLTGKKEQVTSLHFNAGSNNYQIDVSELNNGIYILQLNTESNNAGLTSKIVVNK